MYKAIGTGRHGFHILFFSLELNQGLWARGPSGGPDTLWMRFWMVSTVHRWNKTRQRSGERARCRPTLLKLKHSTWRCGKMIRKHKKKPLDLVLKPQINAAAKAKMAKEAWMSLTHDSAKPFGYRCTLTRILVFFVVFVGFLITAQPTDRGSSKNIRHCMMMCGWGGGSPTGAATWSRSEPQSLNTPYFHPSIN